MANAINKTVENDGDVAVFLNSIENETRRRDSFAVKKIMERITGYPAKLWGTSIVGFGRYHYVYNSGREGDYLRTGFAPRKQNMVIYLMLGYVDYSSYLGRIGKHKTGKSCLYINRLSDIELPVLEELIARAWANIEARYPQ